MVRSGLAQRVHVVSVYAARGVQSPVHDIPVRDTWFGMVRIGAVWSGRVRCGRAGRGTVWRGYTAPVKAAAGFKAPRAVSQKGNFGVEGFCPVWSGWVWYGKVLYGCIVIVKATSGVRGSTHDIPRKGYVVR